MINRIAMLPCVLLLSCGRIDLSEPCYVYSEDDAVAAAMDSTCSGIVVSGDGFTDLSSLSGLNHRCDIDVLHASRLTSIDGLPSGVGFLRVMDAPLIRSIDVELIGGVSVEYDVPSVASISVDFAGGEQSSSVLPRVASRSDLDFVSVNCLDECEFNLDLINQVGSLDVVISGNAWIRLAFIEPSLLGLSDLQAIPVGQLVSVYFSGVSEDSVEVVRQYVEWLESEGFEGSVEVLS